MAKNEWIDIGKLKPSGLPLYQHQIEQSYHILIDHAEKNKQKEM